ncbi:MAG: hypothetical protein EKK48_16055 [Candidatus Melainabacteria bacterium]|nr:MAG: hypothetical protein EKK48_16055 [Candidatus Melainabacteria bacterium]
MMATAYNRIQARKLLDCAYDSIRDKDFDGAFKFVEQALKHNPENVDGYLCRAEIFERLNDNESAISECTKAIEIDPERWVSYSNRAYCQRKSNPEKAIPDCSRVIELTGGKFDAYIQRAGCYLAIGQFDHCVEDATSAFDCDPDGYEALVYRAYGYANLQSWQLALDDLNFLLSHRASKVFLFYRSICLTELGRYAEALEDAQRFDDWFGASKGASEFCRAYAQHAQGDLDAALVNLNFACEKLSEFKPVFEKRAAVYKDLGRSSDAEADLSTASNLELKFFSVNLADPQRDFVNLNF